MFYQLKCTAILLVLLLVTPFCMLLPCSLTKKNYASPLDQHIEERIDERLSLSCDGSFVAFRCAHSTHIVCLYRGSTQQPEEADTHTKKHREDMCDEGGDSGSVKCAMCRVSQQTEPHQMYLYTYFQRHYICFLGRAARFFLREFFLPCKNMWNALDIASRCVHALIVNRNTRPEVQYTLPDFRAGWMDGCNVGFRGCCAASSSTMDA